MDETVAQQQVSQQMFGAPVSNLRRVRQEARQLAILNSGTSANPGIINFSTLNGTLAEYSNMILSIDGRVGASKIDSNLSTTQIIQEIRSLPQITFANEPTAAYHALKHYEDLPPSLQKGDIFGNYFDAAREATRNPVGTPTYQFSQFSESRIFYFDSVHVSPTGRQLRAYIGLSPEGNVSLLSYF
jgi:hypothetical protein